MKLARILGAFCGLAVGGALLSYVGAPLPTIAQGVGQLGAGQIWGNPTTGQNVGRPVTLPYVSATDYSVKCDGTTNDTSAINAALLGANGKVLVFPPNVICMVTPGQIVIGNGVSNVPFAMFGYGTRFKAASVVASPIITVDSPENINAARSFGMTGFIFNCDSKAAYGLKIHGSQTAAYRDLYITGFCTAGGLWLSGEPGFGIYFNDFENIKIDTATGAGLIAKSINNSGNYYIAANVFTGMQSLSNTTGADLDFASISFLNSDFESNTSAGMNINNSIQVDLFGTHFETGTLALTGTNNTKGLRVRGGRTIGTIASLLLAEPSNQFDTTDISANAIIYGPGIIRGYPNSVYVTGEIQGAGNSTTVALAANTLYAFPLIMHAGASWSQIAANITATGTALNMRMGIFGSGTDSLPSTLLLDAGVASANTLGAKAISMTKFLGPGMYYGVIVADGTVTVTGASTLSAMVSNRYAEAIGVTAFATYDMQLSRAFAYGVLSGASPFGAPTRAAAAIPITALRK